MTKLKRTVKVTDDWYPTHEDGTVELTLLIDKNYNFVRMCVWGADDFGLEIDFESDNHYWLEGCFESWKLIYYSISDGVDKDFFVHMGMVNA